MLTETLPPTEQKVLSQIKLNPGEEIRYAIAATRPMSSKLWTLMLALVILIIILMIVAYTTVKMRDYNPIIMSISAIIVACSSIIRTNITYYVLAVSNQGFLLVRYQPNKKLSVKRQWSWPLNEASYQIGGPIEGPMYATVKAGPNQWKLKVQLSYADRQLQLQQIQGLKELAG